MKPAEVRPADDLHMSGAEFDKLMRKALQVAPEQAPQPKPPPHGADAAARCPVPFALVHSRPFAKHELTESNSKEFS